MKTIRDFDFSGKRVLVRADLDVPVNEGEIVDDFRLRKCIPTFKQILNNCEKLIIVGHLGRPEGKDESLSLLGVASRLEELLGEEVLLVQDWMKEDLPEGKILVLENLRFWPGEMKNDPKFAERLASFADIYVNEAFAVSHRNHASMVGVPKLLHGCIGLQLEQELKYLNIQNAARPMVAILGGAKLETKLPVIENLSETVDAILIGGAMIFTLFKAKGFGIGNSLYSELDVKNLLKNKKLILPKDVVVADDVYADHGEVVSAAKIPEGKMGLDIGPATLDEYREILEKAKTVIWNGPLGLYESEPFAKATYAMADLLSRLKCTTIIGGGDTAAVINKLGLADKFTHVSTGGGAALKLLEGEELPALKALHD